MKYLIFVLSFYSLVAVDNTIVEEANYASQNTIVHFYPTDPSLNNSDDQILRYLNNISPVYSTQKTKNFEVLPRVLLKGKQCSALNKANMMRLEIGVKEKIVLLKDKSSYLKAWITQESNRNHLNYCFSEDITKLGSKLNYKVYLAPDIFISCIDTDQVSGTIFFGTKNGQIYEYSPQENKMKKEFTVSKSEIEGIWLFGDHNPMMLYATAQNFFVQHRNDQKSRITVIKPSYRTAYLDINGATLRLIFSHASCTPIIGKIAYNPWDSDEIVELPRFYISGEGISYQHEMFLNTLRFIKELKEKNRNDQIKEYKTALEKKGHVELFEPSIAAIFKEYLCNL